eukprot:2122445-Rhodomonas_salina.1
MFLKSLALVVVGVSSVAGFAPSAAPVCARVRIRMDIKSSRRWEMNIMKKGKMNGTRWTMLCNLGGLRPASGVASVSMSMGGMKTVTRESVFRRKVAPAGQ